MINRQFYSLSFQKNARGTSQYFLCKSRKFHGCPEQPPLYEEFSVWLHQCFAVDSLRLYKAITEYKMQSEQQLPQAYLSAKEICYQFLGFGSIPPVVLLDGIEDIEGLKESGGIIGIYV